MTFADPAAIEVVLAVRRHEIDEKMVKKSILKHHTRIPLDKRQCELRRIRKKIIRITYRSKRVLRILL